MPTPNTGPIPDHHRQWFTQLGRAAENGDLALLSGLDAATGEPRSIIVIAQREDDGGVTFIPLGHMATTDNPYDAYIPPN